MFRAAAGPKNLTNQLLRRQPRQLLRPQQHPLPKLLLRNLPTLIDGTTLADFTGDPVHGETVFLQCKSCHSLEPGQNRIGPSQAGLIGREAGSVEGFQYSEANANSGITWTPEKLYQYLEDPQRVVPGTKMAFPGLPDGQDRADVIAYMQSVQG